jgi:hypothetical protein
MDPRMTAERRMDAWEQLVAAELAADPAVERGTMRGFPCLRWNGRFFAPLEPRSGRLILKLPADRVSELIDAGEGEPFAPNGRTFREWIAIADLVRWETLTGEARVFAATSNVDR